jgi:hypothetical protein
MSGEPMCRCGKRDAWYVTAYRCNHSAFNGYRYTPSDYSEVECRSIYGGCGVRWRTKARYADEVYQRQIARR